MSGFEGNTNSASSKVYEKSRSIAKLSGPIVLSRVGFLLFSLVDIAMVGNYATGALAGISVAHAIVDTFMLIGAGMLYGILVNSSIAIGEDKPRDAGLALQRGIIYAIGLGIVAALGCLAMIPLLGLMGFSEELAATVGDVIFILVIGLVPVLIHIAYSFYLEGISKPLPATFVVLAANVINVVLNYALVYGKFGFSEMGAEGSAWSTTIVRTILALGLIAFVHFMFVEREKYGVNKLFKWAWSSWRMQRQIGYGGGVSFGLEAGAYMALAMIAGVVSPLAAATTAVLINIRSIMFMIPMGIGFATSIHVGMGFGEKDADEINLSTWTGSAIGMGCMAILSLALLLAPHQILAIYSQDALLVEAALSVILLVCIALPLDAWQSIMSSALRGREDAIVPTIYLGIAFVVVMIPGAWWLALQNGGGIAGLFQAVLVGNLVAAALMVYRHLALNSAGAARQAETQVTGG